jgi:mannose-6-phosphate isomerase-like protein (cupin superfamily)
MAGSVHIGKELIEETLAVAPAPGKKMLEPLKSFAKANGVPLNILEDKEVENKAELHRHEADLWQCLSGEVRFELGGELVNPVAKTNPDGTTDECEWKGDAIKGGREVVLKAGDWLWIPAGEPHRHGSAGTARLVIVKIPLAK